MRHRSKLNYSFPKRANVGSELFMGGVYGPYQSIPYNDRHNPGALIFLAPPIHLCRSELQSRFTERGILGMIHLKKNMKLLVGMVFLKYFGMLWLDGNIIWTSGYHLCVFVLLFINLTLNFNRKMRMNANWILIVLLSINFLWRLKFNEINILHKSSIQNWDKYSENWLNFEC